MARGKIVCMYSAKGGVGKTTTLLSLAGTLSKMDKKVLIVDLDLTNGAIAFSLNKDVTKTIYNFAEDYLNNKYDDMDKYITKYDDNISFIACPKDPRQASRISIKYIDILLDKCVYAYDVILIDTASSLNEVNVFALDKSDLIYFVTTNDFVSLKNLKNILNIFEENDFFPKNSIFSLKTSTLILFIFCFLELVIKVPGQEG